jgi:hypothetical protein
MGPGTSLVQRIDWEPIAEVQMRHGFASRGPKGMGCAGLGCAGRGLGCGCKGLGLFDSGIDYTTWGGAEWAIVVIGGYMLLSTFFTTSRAVSRVRAIPGERRKAKAAHYRKLASELSSSGRKNKGLF